MADRIVPDVNDAQIHCGEYVTVLCQIDCTKGEIAFRMKTEYRWTVVATNLVTTSCFIPVVAGESINDLKIDIELMKTPPNECQWVKNAMSSRIRKVISPSPKKKKTESDRTQYLCMQLLRTLLTRWKASLNLTTVISLTDQINEEWILPIVLDILNDPEISPHVLFQQILALQSSSMYLWKKLRDLILLELWKESQRPQSRVDIIVKCLKELTPEWCR